MEVSKSMLGLPISFIIVVVCCCILLEDVYPCVQISCTLSFNSNTCISGHIPYHVNII